MCRCARVLVCRGSVHLSGLSYLGIGLMLAGMFMYHQPDLIAARWAAWPGRGTPRRE
uniref:Uncharacterized protein n=1 Tax=Buteo japonicus TaxID=224669 RepID=A0A8B9Z1H1_9AVES